MGSNDVVILVLVSIPSIIVIFKLTAEGLFADDFCPYEHLKDITTFKTLRLPDGRGFKRFLAAIKYERTRNRLLHIVKTTNLVWGTVCYIIFIFIIYIQTQLSMPIKNFITVVLPYIKVLPYIISVFLVWLGFQVKILQDKIRR